MFTYGQDFYAMQIEGSGRSASVMALTVLGILPARAVCSVKCVVGTWLRTFARRGICDRPGSEGDDIDRKVLQIPVSQFRAV
jgi:hypothetical protein